MSKNILRRYLGVGEDLLLPLSISHGIDFDHEAQPQDITNPEPIHWAYNYSILSRSANFKPAVPIPHPWLLLHRISGCPSASRNGKKLIIGPPPSATNDRELVASLKRNGVSADAILIKSRGSAKVNASHAFWNGIGIDTVTAGDRDDEHFPRLMAIFESFEYVIAPVYSSAIVLAAAMGCKVIVLKDYSHVSYSLESLDLRHMCESDVLRQYLRTVSNEAAWREAIDLSLQITGLEFFREREHIQQDIARATAEVTQPLFIPMARGKRLHSAALGLAASLTGKSSFLKYGVIKGFKYKLLGTQDALLCKRMNLIDALLHGLNDGNLQTRPLKDTEYGVRAGEGGDF